MNRKPIVRKNFYLLAILVLIATASSCSIREIWIEGREWETVVRSEEYAIDPSKLVENIKEGNGETFTLRKATPPVYSPRSNSPIRWNQANYLFIIKTFYQFVWHEPFHEGELVKMRFFLNCDEVAFGPQNASYKFISISKNRDDETRIDRNLGIYADENLARVWEFSYDPNFSQYNFIDLSQVQIPVENALSIAEQHGGEKFRSKYEDKCAIFAELDPNGLYDGWVVEYSLPMSENVKERFRLLINMRTGENKEIR